MCFWNLVFTGVTEVLAHRMRSGLTLLGIVLGVASLVAMSAIVKGMENGMREGLISVGGLEKIRVINVFDIPLHQRHRKDEVAGLTRGDVRALEHNAPLVKLISPTLNMGGRGYFLSLDVSRRGKRVRPHVFSGARPEVLEVNRHEIEHGRMFTMLEDEMAQSVCVIGSGIRDALFENPEETGREVIPLGETIQFNGMPFRIVGMFRHYASEDGQRERQSRVRAAMASNNDDSRKGNAKKNPVFQKKNYTIYIPLKTMQVRMKSGSGDQGKSDINISEFDILVPSVELLEAAVQQIRNVLSVNHKGLEDFRILSQLGKTDELDAFIRNARISGSIIAGIALLAGGIGILNVMLASISERIREIGIRKAVGASPVSIFVQILLESAVIALLGGLLGLGGSFGLIHILSQLVHSDHTPVVTGMSMVVGVSFSLVVGISAGLFPALKASRLHPIQALRYD